MSNELSITEEAMPATFEELSSMAKSFVASGFFTDVTSLSQGIVKIQAGKELGIPPVYAMQNINMIRGKLCSSANTLALLVKRSGHYTYRITEHTDTLCVIVFKELVDGKWVDIGKSIFTIEDAKRARLVSPDSAWTKYPRAMLFSRAISQGARIYCPDAIGGIYTSEEIKSIDSNELEPSVVAAVTKEHWCEEHNSAYFKSAKMRSYGHPIEGAFNEKGKQLWCHEHVEDQNPADAEQAERDTKELWPQPESNPGLKEYRRQKSNREFNQPSPASVENIQSSSEPDKKPRFEPAGQPLEDMTFADLIAWVKARKRTEGWLFKMIGLTVEEAKQKPYQAAMEVKQIAGW